MAKIGTLVGMLFLLPAFWSGPAQSEPVKAVASIKPLHALVAGVMQGTGEPYLIVKGGASPHQYSLKPSDARALEQADIVFWMGEGLERFLQRPIDNLARKATHVSMLDTPGIAKLPYREDGPFEGHAHGNKSHDRSGHASDAHEGIDMHLWLDPGNAKAMVRHIAQMLSKASPENTTRYTENAAALTQRLDKLDAELQRILQPVHTRPFIVFHDSYQYFEKHYGLHPVGSITVNPEVPPGARRVKEISERIRKSGAVCVFAEPQFNPQRVRSMLSSTAARPGMLDPVGAELEPGTGLYFDLMRNLARSMRDCLAQAG